MPSIPTLYECKSRVFLRKEGRPRVSTWTRCGFTTIDREEARKHSEEHDHVVWGSPTGERFGDDTIR